MKRGFEHAQTEKTACCGKCGCTVIFGLSCCYAGSGDGGENAGEGGENADNDGDNEDDDEG